MYNSCNIEQNLINDKMKICHRIPQNHFDFLTGSFAFNWWPHVFEGCVASCNENESFRHKYSSI